MKVYDRSAVVAALNVEKAIDLIEEGFAAYSSGRATVPPVGHLGLVEPPGECHIKYGHIHNDDFFAVKIATGFYENATLDLPNGSGLTIVFSARTGFPQAVLDDGGHLTDVRTAIAGCLSARYLAPSSIHRIGIVGAGVQAGLQLDYLQYATDCKDVTIWARRVDQATELAKQMQANGLRIEVVESLEKLCLACNLIVTATPSTKPLIRAEWIKSGTHITAVGSDGGGKQEIDSALFRKADHCIADSISQCVSHGESHYAIRDGYIKESNLKELGNIISGAQDGRRNDREITVADLTGVAVQDIQIAKSVLLSIESA